MCKNKQNIPLHSDLFVPQLNDINVRQIHPKKLLRLRSVMKSNNNLDIVKKVSTEKFLRAKALCKAKTNLNDYNEQQILNNKENGNIKMESKSLNLNSLDKTTEQSSKQMKNNIKVKSNFAYSNKNNSNNNNNCNNNACNDNSKNNSNDIYNFKNENNNTNNNNTNNAPDDYKYNDSLPNRGPSNSTLPIKNMFCEVSEQLFSSKDEMYLANILLHHYLFHKATNQILNYLLGEINEFQIESDSTLFYEGDEGLCLFIIKSGQVELSQKNSDKKVLLSEGDIFGEFAVLKEGIKRVYTASTLSNLTVYIIDISCFNSIKENLLTKANFNYYLFDFLPLEYKEYLNNFTFPLEFTKGAEFNDLNGIFGIESGELCLLDKNNNKVEIYKKGDIYGIEEILQQKLILNNQMNQKNADNDKCFKMKATENSKCYVIPSFSFIEVFGVEFQKKILKEIFKNILLNNKYFIPYIKEVKIEDLFKIFILVEYKKNEKISRDNKIIIIINGKVLNNSNKEEIKIGEIIGEDLINGKLLGNDFMVVSNKILCLECKWTLFKETALLMKKPLNKTLCCLNRMFLFNNISEWKLIQIAAKIRLENHKKNDIIIKEGKINEFVYFVANGVAKLKYGQETIRDYSNGNSFGEIYILNDKQIKSQIIIASNTCKIYTLNKKDFFALMGDKQLNYLTKKKICLEDTEILPKNLYFVSTLCKNITSNLYIVHNKLFVYVIKAYFLSSMENIKGNEGKIKKIIKEKKMMKRINNPFFVHYVKSFRNNQWCFILMEYIHGMSLEEYIEMCKPQKELILTRFISGCLFIILDLLQNLKIIHRNIKPQNIMINSLGYCQLINFSLSKYIKDNSTKTLIGTPIFMAPEVLSGKGYTYSCDYWSVGITLYYLFYGKYPFGSIDKPPDAIYKEILNKKLTFPDNKNNDFNFLIESLLEKNVKKRISCFNMVKGLNFFLHFNWDDVRLMKYKAPFIPQVIKFNEENIVKNISNNFVDFISKEKFTENVLLDNMDKGGLYSVQDGNDNMKEKTVNWYDMI